MLLGPQIVRKDSENPKASRDLVYEDEKKKKSGRADVHLHLVVQRINFFFQKKEETVCCLVVTPKSV